MMRKKTIKEIVFGDIFDTWDNEGVEFARDKLKKLYLSKYDNLIDIEEKRLILHNLTVAEIEIGYKNNMKLYEMETVKMYTTILKNDMDKVQNYKTGENACLYVRVLINYTECHKSELSKDELKKIYEYCYKVYEQYDDTNENGYLNKLVAEFNLNLISENFNIVLKVLEDILHNNNAQYQEKFEELLNEVMETNSFLYKRVLLLKQNNKLQAI